MKNKGKVIGKKIRNPSWGWIRLMARLLIDDEVMKEMGFFFHILAHNVKGTNCGQTVSEVKGIKSKNILIRPWR